MSWYSKKQTTTSQSTAEAEYVAAGHLAMELTWIQGLLEEMGVRVNLPTVVQEDNQACIEMVKNPVGNPKLKHVLTKYHFVIDCIEAGKVKFVYCETKKNAADIFTKALEGNLFIPHRKALGLIESSSGSVEK